MVRTRPSIGQRDLRPIPSAGFVSVAIFISALILGGCKAEVSTNLQIDGRGAAEASISVFVDGEVADAARKITGRSLSSMIDVEPLTSTGWAFRPGSNASKIPNWSAESFTLSRRIDAPADLSPVMGSFTAGGVRLFDPLALEIRDEPLKVSYRLSGVIRLPALEALLPPLPQTLSEVASISSTDSAMPTLRLVLTVSVPGKVVVYDGEQDHSEFAWQVLPGENRSVRLESEVQKTKRVALWSIGGAFAAVSIAFYIAARRRRASMSLST